MALIDFNLTTKLKDDMQMQHAAPYMLEIFEDNSLAQPMNTRELNTLADLTLEKHRAFVLMHNLGNDKSNQLRVPTKLTTFEVAVLLLACYQFKNIKLSDSENSEILHVYSIDDKHEGLYTANSNVIEELIRSADPTLSNYSINDCLAMIKSYAPNAELTNNKNLVAVNNGIFNKKTKTLEPFSPDYVFTSKLAIDYNPNAQNPMIPEPDGSVWNVCDWLKEIINDDDQVYKLLWQVVADVIQGSHSSQRAIFFYSELGNNGKGTFGTMLKALIGRGNYSSVPIADFSKEFHVATIVNKIANIADENDVDQFIDSVRDFKASITGDDIMINNKYEKPFSYRYTGANIQMINGLPKTRDKSDSFYRRVILVPFLKSFTNNGEKTYIKQDFVQRKDVLEFVLYTALHLDFTEYDEPDISKELLHEYKSVNNPVLQYWEEMSPEFVWDLVPTQFLYDLFVQWSYRNNPVGKPMGKKMFISNMKSILDKDTEWDESFNKNQRTQQRMDNDEVLITDYDMTNWMVPNIAPNSRNQSARRNFTKKDYYRGIVRK